MIVHFFEDEAGEHRYQLKGDNGEVMATSEGYTTPADAERGHRDLVANVLESQAEAVRAGG